VLNTIEKQLAGKAAKEGGKTLALPAPQKLLSLPAPVVSEAVKEASGKIKSFPSFETAKEHIFSDDHIKRGLWS